MHNILITLMVSILPAAVIQETLPERSGDTLTMAQLTPGNPDYLYAKSLLNTGWTDDGRFEYTLPESAAEAKGKSQKKINGTMSADGLWRAVCQGDRLYIIPEETEAMEDGTDKEDAKQWVSDTEDNSGIVWGQSVHRNEFGIEGGLFWSPMGHKLAFYRMDESMVGQYPLVHTDDREATVQMVRYPMAGMTSHQVTLGVHQPVLRETVYMQTNSKPLRGLEGEQAQLRTSLNDPEHYLTCVSWRPDGKQVAIAELNREQNYMELNLYDVKTGFYSETLFRIKAKRYVEPQHPLYFLPGSDDLFIWQDDRTGYNHLYLYDLANELEEESIEAFHQYQGMKCRALTQGDWMVTELIGVDPKARNVYFMGTKDGVKESHLYSVNIRSGKMTRLTTEPGIHRIKMSPDYTRFYDAYSNATTPRICQTVEIKSGRRVVIYKASDPYQGYARPSVEVGTLKAADDSTDLCYRMVKPLGFDASRKYPVVVYLYNGPHNQLVTDGFDYGLPGWDCYMASKGFVVFTIDGRGSSHRGSAFEQAIWHNLGHNEGEDQMRGVAYLKSLPFIDANRIGIYGWSYGGFMTTYMILNHSETFSVGVCGGPVLDWSRYEVMYGERYMGTPQNNPEGYERTALIHQANKLKGRLLIIHDDQDATVVPQMSMQFLKNSVEAGTYPDFLMYANHAHNVRGKDRIHLLNRIANYFIEHL